jgi:hypothetical protein
MLESAAVQGTMRRVFRAASTEAMKEIPAEIVGSEVVSSEAISTEALS